MKKIYLFILTSFVFCNVYSQDIETDPDAGTGVPIDGGIVTVTLIAAAYGAKRRQEKKDKED
jgi:hypothetical protein